jgi:hypothetical protein
MTGLVVRGRVPGRHADREHFPHGRSAWSTPARIRTAAIAALVLACCLAGVAAIAFGGVNNKFQSIGGRDAPEVDAATGLYFSLGDMDAQVANVLLVGGDPALAADRSQDLAIYAHDRTTADQDLQQAAITEAGNAAAQREIRSIIDGIGQYEALAADAMLSDQRAPDAAGRATAASVAYYRQATDLMRTGILPEVGALTTVSASALDAGYQSGRATAGTGIMQLYLFRRFRRLVNPALAAATLVGVVLVGVTAAGLSAESGHLKVAKQDAFDSLIALTQARAVSYDANADESRYLVDPGRAAQYQQSFLSKSQGLADVGNVGIFGYDAALAADIRAYSADDSDVAFGGYLGAEFRNITFTGERAAAVRTLLAYQVYERDDRVLRALANKDPGAAVAFDTGTARGQSDWAFNQYDAALSSVIAINSSAFASAVAAGQGGAGDTDIAIYLVGAALLAGLVIFGVRPRLAEYR